MSNDKLAKNYSEECAKKCADARKYITDLMEDSRTGSITVKELHYLTSHISQVLKLFCVVNTETSASVDFAQVIAQRNSELEKFRVHYNSVKVLVEYCKDIAEGTLLVLRNQIIM